MITKNDNIYRKIGDPQWDEKFEKVEKALGFPLFYWQKSFISRGEYRQSGETTAHALRLLMDVSESKPIDFSKPASTKKELIFRNTVLELYEKLRYSDIPLRKIITHKGKVLNSHVIDVIIFYDGCSSCPLYIENKLDELKRFYINVSLVLYIDINSIMCYDAIPESKIAHFVFSENDKQSNLYSVIHTLSKRDTELRF